MGREIYSQLLRAHVLFKAALQTAMPLTDLDATAGDTLRCLAGHMRVDPVVSELEACENATL
eukprot:4527852-Amphidinium_carterae.1